MTAVAQHIEYRRQLWKSNYLILLSQKVTELALGSSVGSIVTGTQSCTAVEDMSFSSGSWTSRTTMPAHLYFLMCGPSDRKSWMSGHIMISGFWNRVSLEVDGEAEALRLLTLPCIISTLLVEVTMHSQIQSKETDSSSQWGEFQRFTKMFLQPSEDWHSYLFEVIQNN